MKRFFWKEDPILGDERLRTLKKGKEQKVKIEQIRIFPELQIGQKA